MSNFPSTPGSSNTPQPQLSNPTSLTSHRSLLSQSAMMALDHFRLSQLYQYALAAERFRCPPPTSVSQSTQSNALVPATSFLRPDLAMAAAAPFLYNNPYYRLDPRIALYRPPEEPKPQHSYIGLIAMAILSHPEKKLVLSDIYQYILDNYAYFRTRGHGWRNSIRHNLSLNDCFVKAGRSANGKGHYWAIHPANIEDFQKGDFRRRKAQRKVRRHMGLAVDDEDSPSPPPNSPPLLPLLGPTGAMTWPDHHHNSPFIQQATANPHLHPSFSPAEFASLMSQNSIGFSYNSSQIPGPNITRTDSNDRNHAKGNLKRASSFERGQKRQFDVASLLAPEMRSKEHCSSPHSSRNSEIDDHDQSSSSPSLEKSYNKLSSPQSLVFHEDEIEDEKESLVDECDTPRKNGKRGRKETEPTNVTTSAPVSPTSKKTVYCKRTPDIASQMSHSGNEVHGPRKGQSIRSNFCRDVVPHLNETSRSRTDSHDLKPHFPITYSNATSASRNGDEGTSFNPTNQLYLQQNPSLASLMILSSRYRELASTMHTNTKRS